MKSKRPKNYDDDGDGFLRFLAATAVAVVVVVVARPVKMIGVIN